MKKIIFVLLTGMLLSACGLMQSKDLAELKKNLESGNYNNVIEIMAKSPAKDITPWLKNNIYKYSPVYLYVFTQRLIIKNAPFEEVLFTYTEARYASSIYFSFCNYEEGGAGALFSSLSVITQEQIHYKYNDTPEWKSFFADKENQEKLNKDVSDWGKKVFDKFPNNFCEDGEKYPAVERDQKFADFKAGVPIKESARQETGNAKVLYAQMLSLLNMYSNAQQRFFLVNGTYTKDFAAMDIETKDDSGNKISGNKYRTGEMEIKVYSNPNAWVVSAEKVTPGKRAIIIKNIRDGYFCCTDIDANSCEISGLDSKDCNTVEGIKITPRQ